MIIFDADFGLANVEVMFGAIPQYNLSDLIYQVENAGGFTCRILIAGEQIRFVTQERGFR